MFIWIVHVHVVLSHREQQELHELLLAAATWEHLLIGLYCEVLSEKVAKDSLFFPFGMPLCPLVDPLFNLSLFHVLLDVQIVGANFNGQVALLVQPSAELLELEMSAQRLHVLDVGNEGRGRFVQNVRCGRGCHC